MKLAVEEETQVHSLPPAPPGGGVSGFLPCFDEVLLWEVEVVYVAVVVCPGTGQALGHPAAEVGETG